MNRIKTSNTNIKIKGTVQKKLKHLQIHDLNKIYPHSTMFKAFSCREMVPLNLKIKTYINLGKKVVL